jgi:hypothetical protein
MDEFRSKELTFLKVGTAALAFRQTNIVWIGFIFAVAVLDIFEKQIKRTGAAGILNGSLFDL